MSMAMGTGNRGGLRANFGSDDVVSMGSGGGGNDSRVVGAVRKGRLVCARCDGDVGTMMRFRHQAGVTYPA